ncbi:PIG-L family deacetylase [Mobilitalea sibirica]|uniref:PIG-L family deacetylase n=1 Tax=Mobilitalea sibirica TaxID=1462919 RepID=A0A8J7HBM8_9FIRM|nr:PIG-L deacetylase family protein [Mobilitalea sibirica]MBH1939409.1 PIG-L family deacetylase [Mobilitalea sibirica]
MIVLVIAPHADDEILGVGATMAKYLKEGHKVYVCIATKGRAPLFSEELVETVLEEAGKCHRYLGIEKTFYLDLPAAMLETVQRHEVNRRILEVVEEVEPDITFIPHHGDMQKDHQIIAEASLVALRPKYLHRVKEIYAYETLSETEWNLPHAANSFLPNVYHDISDYLVVKLKAMEYYRSQLAEFPNPRSLQAMEALARVRGSTVNVKAAEAFALVRMLL